ncbi:HLA class II histocompatibility antigen, DR beta 5 chain-like [Varanus komodoensis]|uniref:HLA class II histocompatibility antigen, DR beta 5 chain-like n=1 Tax=Varanus komodoensis TaxID=61221 RepID=UPI001CF7A6EF|nr:HLA class II histocompatibility antigen, DR beta 5 chain-like [Varanus komodoensis]
MGTGWILPVMLVLLLGPPLVPGGGGRQGPSAPRRFLHQDKSECRFSNVTGREQVRFLYRFIYDRAEIARYDSARGRYDALTPLGEPDVQLWNSQKEELEFWQNKVDTFCRYNYGVAAAGSIVGRREPRASESARSKVWTGVMGALLGMVYLAVGLSLYLRSKKASAIQQPPGKASPCLLPSHWCPFPSCLSPDACPEWGCKSEGGPPG